MPDTNSSMYVATATGFQDCVDECNNWPATGAQYADTYCQWVTVSAVNTHTGIRAHAQRLAGHGSVLHCRLAVCTGCTDKLAVRCLFPLQYDYTLSSDNCKVRYTMKQVYVG